MSRIRIAIPSGLPGGLNVDLPAFAPKAACDGWRGR
jgi:hypothetical protein